MKKLLSLLLCASLCLAALTGCEFNVSKELKERAALFADGKDIGEPIMLGADQALLEMLDQYNGSLYIPKVSKLPDDFQADPNGPVFPVSSDDQLMNALTTAFINNWTTLNIRCENNYLADVTEDEGNGILKRIRDQIRRAEPLHASGVTELGWSTTCIHIQYFRDAKELPRIKKMTEDRVAEKAEQIRRIADTKYEQIFAVNRMLCDEVTYAPGKSPYPSEAHTPYGALQNKVAVCDGYATAAMLILRELGIECDIQFGVGITEKQDPNDPTKTIKHRGLHAWNLVYLDNHWYQMDITWNDSANSLYQYFLVTDSYMAKNHDWTYHEYPKTPMLRYNP